MQHRLFRIHAHIFNFRSIVPEELLALFLALFIFIVPASADMRFANRGLYMQSSEPNVTTSYTVSFQYMSPQAVGSVDMLFCIDPIPYMPCVTPPGLDVSQAALTAQTGETGYTILNKSSNHIVLTRLPSVITSGGSASSYKFDNVVNPSQTNQSFSIRLKSLGSIDGSGSQIDFGSVKGEVQTGTVIETQVPPMLLFCVAQQVQDNCTGTNDAYYSDLGTLSSNSTLTAESQMAVGTNASGGFAITANGTTMAAGTNVIDSLNSPTQSIQGTNQFGMNLVANSEPTVGTDPQGTFANAVASPDYGIPNQYKYVPGDVVAFSPNVSLMKKFTVSYIVNSSRNLHAGVYTTTITYIASGRF